jgi:hypothetical protein
MTATVAALGDEEHQDREKGERRGMAHHGGEDLEEPLIPDAVQNAERGHGVLVSDNAGDER